LPADFKEAYFKIELHAVSVYKVGAVAKPVAEAGSDINPNSRRRRDLILAPALL
jgi:hypothetical protein